MRLLRRDMHFSNYKEAAVLLVLSLFIVLFSGDFHFFWDNVVQLSIPANYYYHTDFATILLPDQISTGHQPFVGAYLAIGYKLFGRSLLAAHLLMLPAIFLILLYVVRLVRHFTAASNFSTYLGAACVILFSTLLSQLTLLTFEIFQVAFVLAVTYSLINGRKGSAAIFFLLLNMISLRATLAGFGIIAAYCFSKILRRERLVWSDALPFLPGLLFFSVFLLYFYAEKGWIIHNTVANHWAVSAKPAEMKDYLRNLFIFAWRFVDLGFVGFVAVWMLSWKRIILLFRQDRYYFILFTAVFQLQIILAVTLPYQNTIAHRYLLSGQILFAITTVIFLIKSQQHRQLFLVLMVVISGYFWLYTREIAKDWDAMPAHWAYYQSHREMESFIKNEHIDSTAVSSFFPNDGRKDDIFLNGNPNVYSADVLNTRYCLYSNVYNVPDEVLQVLFDPEKYAKKHVIKHHFVECILFEKR